MGTVAILSQEKRPASAMRALLLALGAAALKGVDLTPENWDDETAGKTVFVKFYAPWCGHCKKMKPDWDKLMNKFADHPTTMIVDVDCIDGGKGLCDQNGVQGFPTIKYGDPTDLTDYDGGREYADLEKFANDLKPMCSVANIDLCDADKKALIEKYQAMDDAALAELIETQEKEQADASKEFDDEVAKLQEEYERLSKEKDDTVKEVKDSGLSVMKSVAAYLEKRGCDVETFEGCSDKEQAYVEKMKGKGGFAAEKERLTKMLDGKMKPDQKAWLNTRISLLTKLAA